jgi:hypothetical protein
MAHPDRLLDKKDAQVLIGWTHSATPGGIKLSIQSARSKIAMDNEQVEASHVLMTRNQALLLSKYLVDVTGQLYPARQSKSVWSRIKSGMGLGAP